MNETPAKQDSKDIAVKVSFVDRVTALLSKVLNKKSIEHERVLEIKHQNAQAINQAIEQASIYFLQQLSGRGFPDRLQFTTNLELTNAKGTTEATELGALFIKTGADEYSPSHWEMGIFIAPEAKLRLNVYAAEMSYYKADLEIAARTWSIVHLAQKNQFYIYSHVTSGSKYQGLGISSSILSSGERFKDSLAKRLAQELAVKKITSSISDYSDKHWTSRQVARLPGYNDVTPAQGGVKIYEKVVELGDEDQV